MGPCRGGVYPRIAACVKHTGEEPPLCGKGGSGAIFFSGCPLRCVYCQNYRISQYVYGKEVSLEELALAMCQLEQQGCVNINLVSPTHYVPQIVEAVQRARAMGLTLPMLYNTHSFDSLETIDYLEGIVDIYVPDLRYSDDQIAERYSGVKGYCAAARSSIERMLSQVGHLTVDPVSGLAGRGVLVRILVLPGDLAGVKNSLVFLRKRFGPELAVSLMAQYHPMFKAEQHPPLDRTITPEEYEEAVNCALALGFEEVWIQDLDSPSVGLPDFSRAHPFTFETTTETVTERKTIHET